MRMYPYPPVLFLLPFSYFVQVQPWHVGAMLLAMLAWDALKYMAFWVSETSR